MVRAWPAIICAVATLGAAQAASAAQICAWMDETVEPEDARHVQLWLQSDGEVEFLYEIGGKGLVDASGKSHSPSSGTFLLHPGEKDSPWSFGATLSPPGRIDVTVTLHAPTPSIFDPPGPVIATYAFRREVREGEKSVPPVLAQKQCVTLSATSTGR
jgi:hypothetical protein